jgi:hypothetical protein
MGQPPALSTFASMFLSDRGLLSGLELRREGGTLRATHNKCKSEFPMKT